MEINEKIKQLRVNQGLTQKELAAQLHVSSQAISNWETGKNYPDIQLIVNIADIFNISLDDLLRSDQEIIQKLARDTLVRKKQRKKIAFLSIAAFFLLLFVSWQSYILINQGKDLSKAQQIQQVEDTGKTLEISLLLPFYQSQNSFLMNPSYTDDTAVGITIGTHFSLKEHNTHLSFNKKRDILAIFPKAKKLVFVSTKGKVLKEVYLTTVQ